MLNWTTIRANLTAWAQSNYGSGLSSDCVVWRDTKYASSYRGKGRIVLDITSPVTLGTDEVVYADAAAPVAGGELDVTVKGSRTMVLEVLAEVQDQRAGFDAMAYMERLRTSLRLPSTTVLFKAAGLGFARVLSDLDLESVYQGRRGSAVQMDVLLNARAELNDTAATYIETVEYETEFLGADGLPIAHQLDGDLDLTP